MNISQSNTAFFRNLWLTTLALGFNTQATAQSIQGVLEQSGAYSALFTASPETGDLIGYPFKNNSLIGKNILANCLPGLVCKIGKATTREMQDPSALKFNDQPMGWMEITRAANVNMVSGIGSYEKSSKTRYGVLTINDDTRTLQFKGKPVLPTVEGNNSLSIVATYELGKNDVVLLQNNGGTACPALYVFITINATGLRATPEFGTCSDIVRVTSDLKNVVTLVTVGSNVTAALPGVKKHPTKAQSVFRYVNGQVIESGKPVT